MGEVRLVENPRPPCPPQRSRRPWRIIVARYAEAPAELTSFEPLTEESRRLVEESVEGEVVHSLGRVEEGALLYAVEVEGGTLEEALEEAEKAARMVEEVLLVYR